MRKRWAKWLGGALVVLCLFFFIRQAVGLLANDELDLRGSFALFPAAIASYMAAYLAFGLGWHQLLAALNRKSGYWVDLGVFTSSQFGKYLPGNVGHHVGRVALAAKYGHPTYVVIAAMIVELCAVLGAMAVLSLPSLGYWIERLGLKASALSWYLAAAVAGGMLFVAAAMMFRRTRALAKLMEAFKLMVSGGRTSLLRLAAGQLAIVLGIILTAASLGLLDSSASLLSPALFPALISVFAAAWLLGFLVPGAPAGIGVRELVLTEGLAPLVGKEQSILIALLFRILSTLCDLLALAGGAAILYLNGRTRATR